MPELPAQVTAIVKALTAKGYLEHWTIDAIVEPLDSKTAAYTERDFELHRARIKIDPEWQTKTPGTLEELIRHELGHACVGDVFDFLRGHAAEAAEEALATRFGLMLEK